MTATLTPSAKGLTIADTGTFDGYTIGAISDLNHKGDTTVMWDTRNEAEVAEAKRVFAELSRQGKMAVATTKLNPNGGDQIKEFDPKAEHIVMVSQFAGG